MDVKRLNRKMPLSLGTLVAALACGSGDENGITGTTEDTTPPAVVSTSPSAGATGVAIASSVSATFSEPLAVATINAGTFTLSGGVTGTVTYSGLMARLVPDSDLDYSTVYTASVGSGITDVAGNSLGADLTWSFTTEAMPIPPFSLPFAAGRRWLYSVDWSRTVVGSTIGVRTTTFTGQAVVHVDEQVPWEGRSAWRVLRYDLEDLPASSPLKVEEVYLSESPDGLHKWVATGTGGEWRQVVSTRDVSFGNNAFFMAGSPRGPTTTMSTASVSVPAGTFGSLRANVDFTKTGQFEPEDIFEDRSEYYADGVGLVRADWDFDFDDNDPAAFDVFEDGIIELTHVDTGPIPEVAADTEPNDVPTASGSQAIGPLSVVEGRVAINDAGSVVNDPDVFPNIDGIPLLQDWYRFSTVAPQDLRVDLIYETLTDNDLDVYLFREVAPGSVTYVSAGTKPPGKFESVVVPSLAAGSYYVAIQAWNTPTGSVAYWFSIR